MSRVSMRVTPNGKKRSTAGCIELFEYCVQLGRDFANKFKLNEYLSGKKGKVEIGLLIFMLIMTHP